MACYHFTIKPDKKPDGTQIKAIEHIEYIDREGKYQDIDHELKALKFQGNMIAPPSLSQTEPESASDRYLLYRSPFGSLRANGDKLESTANASMETLCIALYTALKKYGNEIHIEGDKNYKNKLIYAAVEMDLPVKFTDPNMEKQKNRLRELKYNGRREEINTSAGRNAGGDDGSAEGNEGRTRRGIKADDGLHSKQYQPDFERLAEIPPPQRRNCLQTLSSCPMVQYAEGAELLLPRNVPDQLDNQRTQSHTTMRWHLSDEKEKSLKNISDEIISREIKRTQLLASAHVDYINRNKKFAAKGGCVYKAHHLPKWANNSAKKFFEVADEYEGVGYSRYKEIEFALPNELSLEQQKELIQKFLDKHLKDFYYAYAIHDKVGAMSNGQHNTHVHIMFSERELDEREKNSERKIGEFFTRPSTAKGKKVGGCKKHEKWNGKDRAKYLCVMRKDFALIQNEFLEKYGFSVRVDHRSLKEQHREALLNGDLKLAELLNRMPEEHVGPEIAQNKNHEKVIALQKYRQEKYEHQKLLYAAELLEQNISKQEALMQKDKNTAAYAALSSSGNLKAALKETSKKDTVHALKLSVLNDLKEVHALNNVAIWNDQAVSLAKEKFMSFDERETYHEMQERKKRLDGLIDFEKNLKQPPEWNHEANQVYGELKNELGQIKTKISNELKILAEKLKPVTEKLNTPVYKDKIQKETLNILKENKSIKAMLNEANEKLSQSVSALQSEIAQISKDIIEENEINHAYTAKEIDSVLKVSLKNLQKESETTNRQIDKLKNKVLTLPRAKEMAMDIYTNHAFKKLREKRRELNKERPRIDAAKIELEAAIKLFDKIPVPKWYQSKNVKEHYQAEKAKIDKMRQSIHVRECSFSTQEENLNNELKLLEKKCSEPAAASKISEITLGILKKNKPISDRFETLMKKDKELSAFIKDNINLQKGVNSRIAYDAKNGQCKYSVIRNAPPNCGGTNSPWTIAKAMNGDSKMARLVMYSKKDSATQQFENSAKNRIDYEAELDSIE